MNSVPVLLVVILLSSLTKRTDGSECESVCLSQWTQCLTQCIGYVGCTGCATAKTDCVSDCKKRREFIETSWKDRFAMNNEGLGVKQREFSSNEKEK